MPQDILTTLGATTAADGTANVLHYRIDRRLGEGGMGVVFAGFDLKLQRDVAIKVLKPEVGEVAASRTRFVAEARSLAAVEHDNVVRIHAVEAHNDLPFIVMEQLCGRTLAELLQRERKLEPIEAVRIARQIASGLHAAHERRILHRDIKPQNVWLEAESHRVKLLDFGLAEPIGTDGRKFSGTPAYLSPEQARSEPVDQRTDLYSLGVVLFQTLTGQLPFAANNRSAMLVALVTANPLSLRDVSPSLPDSLAELVDSLLSKDKSNRPASANAVLRALEQTRKRLQESSIEKLRRRVTAPTTLLLLASVIVPALATWFVLNAASRPKVIGQTGTSSLRVAGRETSLEAKVVTLPGTITDGIIRFPPPAAEWTSVVDCATTIDSDASNVRLFGILKLEEPMLRTTTLNAGNVDGLLRSGALRLLDVQSRGEPGWLGRDGQFRSGSQELVTFVRSQKDPQLLAVFDGELLQSADSISMNVEVVNEPDE